MGGPVPDWLRSQAKKCWLLGSSKSSPAAGIGKTSLKPQIGASTSAHARSAKHAAQAFESSAFADRTNLIAIFSSGCSFLHNSRHKAQIITSERLSYTRFTHNVICLMSKQKIGKLLSEYLPASSSNQDYYTSSRNLVSMICTKSFAVISCFALHLR